MRYQSTPEKEFDGDIIITDGEKLKKRGKAE